MLILTQFSWLEQTGKPADVAQCVIMISSYVQKNELKFKQHHKPTPPTPAYKNIQIFIDYGSQDSVGEFRYWFITYRSLG